MIDNTQEEIIKILTENKESLFLFSVKLDKIIIFFKTVILPKKGVFMAPGSDLLKLKDVAIFKKEI